MSRPTTADLEAKGKEVLDAYVEAVMRVDLFDNIGVVTAEPSVIYDEYSSVVDWFTRFAENDPERLETMLESLRYTTTSLKNPDLESMSSVHDTVEDWQGPAADSFYENFVTPFPRIRQNHLELSIELDTALVAAIEIMDAGRRDAIAVGDNAIEVLNSMKPSGGGGGLSMALTIVGAVAGVAATIATGGAATIAWALIGSVAGVGAAATAPTATISAASPEEALRSVTEALSDIHTAMGEEEVILAEALVDDIVAISADDLFLPNPVILSDPRSRTGDFRLPAGVEN